MASIQHLSTNQDGSGMGVFAQRYDSLGDVVGNEFRVNTFTAGDQFNPAAAVDSAGSFVIVWESLHQDGSGAGIYAQRYDAQGNPQGAEFRVNTHTQNNQSYPFVAKDTSGKFVVVWTSTDQDGSVGGVFGQRYDALGKPLPIP